jgi:recombination protein RecT
VTAGEPEIRDAATVIVARDAADGPLVFMVRRSAKAAFLPDLYVFPGGRVDQADHADAGELLTGSAGAVDPVYAMTAARETFEEVGLLFADRPIHGPALIEARRALLAGQTTFGRALRELGVAVDATLLRYFSNWVTPKGEYARRFDTRFFVARAPLDQVAEADAFEVTDGRWLRPRDALAAHARGEIGLIFPTIKHLERIAPYATVDALLEFARTKPIVTVAPVIEDGRRITMQAELDGAW